MVLPLIGLGTYALGSIGDAYGQSQALNAMRDVWANATREQAGYDQALNERQQQMLASINPQSILGGEQAAQLQGKMDASARDAVNAIRNQAGRRKGNVEGNAVGRQAQGGSLADLLRSGRLAAMMQGFQQGGQGLGEQSRNLGIQSRIIGDDARSAAGMTAMKERNAGMTGAWARAIGSSLKGLGQAGMMYGMAQPAGAGPASSASTLDGLPYNQAGYTEMPIGGWAASRQPIG